VSPTDTLYSSMFDSLIHFIPANLFILFLLLDPFYTRYFTHFFLFLSTFCSCYFIPYVIVTSSYPSSLIYFILINQSLLFLLFYWVLVTWYILFQLYFYFIFLFFIEPHHSYCFMHYVIVRNQFYYFCIKWKNLLFLIDLFYFHLLDPLYTWYIIHSILLF
jgi:hypothetical protein